MHLQLPLRLQPPLVVRTEMETMKMTMTTIAGGTRTDGERSDGVGAYPPV